MVAIDKQRNEGHVKGHSQEEQWRNLVNEPSDTFAPRIANVIALRPASVKSL